MKNVILFLSGEDNRNYLHTVSQHMEIDNCLVYKSKLSGNWYKWERDSIGRPVSISKEERKELLTNSRIINWGNYILHDQDNIILNKPSACKLSSNKWNTRKIWQENGILTPESSNTWTSMTTFPFIARPQKHSRQSEFHIINNLEDLCKLQAMLEASEFDWYYQKIVPKTCEFRVYVGGDKVLTIFWKEMGEGVLSSNNKWSWLDTVNWNADKLPPIFTDTVRHETLWYTLPQFKEDIQKIKEESIKATKVLGLNYSGIDVGLDTTTRTFHFFESNTNPELTPLPQKKFAQYFDKVLQSI